MGQESGGRLPEAPAASVALIGLPGAGKSVVAPLLADRLGWVARDLDVEIERSAGRRIPELIQSEGEAAFRGRETEALRRELAPERGRRVVACGGGVVTNEHSSRLLRLSATVVWLQVSPEAALERLGAAGIAGRPLLQTGPAGGEASDALARLRALLTAREPLYRALAAFAIDTAGATPAQVAASIESSLRERWAGSAS